jgi:hypothetical protein
MTRSRILSLCFLLLLLAVPVACVTSVPVTQPPVVQHAPSVPSGAANVVTCKMFALGELGEDASYAKWIVETIPNVIQPGTWDQKKGAAENRTLSYHAPAKILVVYHTPAVHAKVDEFLKDLKKATAAKAKKPAAIDPAVQHAQFVPAQAPAPTPPGYPVAGPLQQPKHLFHFIIRYEGDGLVDANVVKFAKALQSAVKSETTANAEPPVQAVPSAPPPTYYSAPAPTPVVVVPPPPSGTAPPPPPIADVVPPQTKGPSTSPVHPPVQPPKTLPAESGSPPSSR